MYSLTFRFNLLHETTSFQGQSEVEMIALTKSVYLPISSLAGSPSLVKKHGDTFTLYGQHAVNLKRLIENGQVPYCEIYEVPAEDELATLTTDSLEVSNLTCDVQGTIISEGSSPVTEYGFVYSAITESPTIESNKEVVGTDSFTGAFDVNFNVDFQVDDVNMNGSGPLWFAAYATNDVGTAYGNVLMTDPNPWLCLIQGTMITLANGKQKRIEEVSYNDELLVWNFDEAKFDKSHPIWIMKSFKAPRYSLVKFNNGIELGTIDDGKGHSIFNIENGEFTHMMSEHTPIGTSTYTKNGKLAKVVNKQIVHKPVSFYNVITNYHMNIFTNNILTSTGMNNLYPINGMKFIKNRRSNQFDVSGISSELQTGLRLSEQQSDVRNKVLRMIKHQKTVPRNLRKSKFD